MNELTRQQPIGLFDSGLGGLTVVREIRKRLPNERCIYLGDTARTPWGTKSPEIIRRYAQQCVTFLEEREVKLIVVACNTASSAAFKTLVTKSNFPIIDVIQPAAHAAARSSRNRRIGVIGTEATVSSNAYTNVLHQIDSGIQVFSRSCSLFVPLAEEGLVSGPIVRDAVEYYLSALRSAGIDTLILGCTHYPLLEAEIRSYLGEGVKLIDCGCEVAEVVKATLEQENLLVDEVQQSRDDFFLTDTPLRFEKVAESFLGTNNIKAVKVDRL